MAPVLSVVMPAYNGEKSIEKSIDSVLRQTYGDLELIVVNDGSTDATGEILRQFGEDITLLEQDNHGFSHAVSRGITSSAGRYISFIGQDDAYLPDKSGRQVELLDTHSEYALVHSPGIFVNERGERLFRWGGWGQRVTEDAFYRLYTGIDPIIHPSVMLRKEILSDFGAFPFDPGFRICSDYLLYMQLARRYRFYEFEDPLVLVGKWEGRLSEQRELMFREEREVKKRARQLYRISFFPGLFTYARALSNQCLREAEHYLDHGSVSRALLLGVKAFFYFPLNFSGWSRSLGRIFRAVKGAEKA